MPHPPPPAVRRRVSSEAGPLSGSRASLISSIPAVPVPSALRHYDPHGRAASARGHSIDSSWRSLPAPAGAGGSAVGSSLDASLSSLPPNVKPAFGSNLDLSLSSLPPNVKPAFGSSLDLSLSGLPPNVKPQDIESHRYAFARNLDTQVEEGTIMLQKQNEAQRSALRQTAQELKAQYNMQVQTDLQEQLRRVDERGGQLLVRINEAFIREKARIDGQATAFVRDYHVRKLEDDEALRRYDMWQRAHEYDVDHRCGGGGRHLLRDALQHQFVSQMPVSQVILQDALMWSGGPLCTNTRVECIAKGRQLLDGLGPAASQPFEWRSHA